jgi:anti-anti-sigma regulatory factor
MESRLADVSVGPLHSCSHTGAARADKNPVSDSSDCPLKISGELSIRTLDQWHETLNSSRNLALDLSEVSACDTAALQLICAARKSGFEIAGISPVIQQIAAAIGLRLEDVERGRDYGI